MSIFFVERMGEAFAEKLLSFFQQKIQCIWLLSCKTLNELTLNELVKLMMLLTARP